MGPEVLACFASRSFVIEKTSGFLGTHDDTSFCNAGIKLSIPPWWAFMPAQIQHVTTDQSQVVHCLLLSTYRKDTMGVNTGSQRLMLNIRSGIRVVRNQRFSLTASFSLSSLVSSRRKKTFGTRVS